MQQAQKDIRQGHFYFDPEDPIYKDHFPGHAVVPGSLIVSAFLKAAREQHRQAMTIAKNFRFRRFVSPGHYAYQIERIVTEEKERLVCTLYENETRVATGTLL